ncbi:MAG TPA: hypothetical protein VFS40_13990 [Gemmatimonadales bacterium]|nr:hypothetical protein [Gemmatimonadales bacterium]
MLRVLRTPRVLVGAALLGAPLLGAPLLGAPLRAQTALPPSRDWSPEDRAVVGDFSRITAVAAGMDRVFVASPTGLALYDPQFQRWQGSVPPPPGVDFSRVFQAAVDPLDGSAWFAKPDGWLRYQPDLRTWDQGTVPAGVRAIAFDLDAPGAGAYVRTAQGWMTIPHGGGIAMPSPAPTHPVGLATIGDAIRSNPALQANSAQILLDNRLRSVRYTAAARSYDGRGWFLGTWGVGLLYVQDGGGLPQRLPFGLPGQRVGALFGAPDGVWVATDRTVQDDAGLTLVDGELTRFQTLRPPSALGYGFQHVYRLTGQGKALWAATDAGLARIDPASGDTRTLDEGRGLPDARVYAVASSHGLITVATAHGLARVDDSLKARRIAKNFTDPAYALSVRDDTTWVGTPIGVFAALEGADDLVQPAALGTSALFRAPVYDFAWVGDTLVALTPDRLLYRDARGTWAAGPVLSATLGRLRMLVADRDGLWVGGDRGVGFARPNTLALRPLLLGDLPDVPTSLAIEDGHLWVGTLAGLVRWRLDAIRP